MRRPMYGHWGECVPIFYMTFLCLLFIGRVLDTRRVIFFFFSNDDFLTVYLMARKGGLYVFQLFDYYACSGIPLIAIALLESLCIGWIYGELWRHTQTKKVKWQCFIYSRTSSDNLLSVSKALTIITIESRIWLAIGLHFIWNIVGSLLLLLCPL